jgi:putative phosphoesterase
MKIAIISDSHDNMANLKKAMDWIKKEEIEVVIHCGDVCAPATLREILQEFSGKFHLVFGNVDGDRFGMAKIAFKEFPGLKIWGELGELEIDGKKIAFTHFPRFAQGLAAEQQYDIIFYGHDHKPWEKKIGKTRLVNPGNLAGLFYKASFAVYDTKTDKLELKILEKL